MLRLIIGIIAGVVGWAVIVTLLNLALRWLWPAYAASEPQMLFDLPMMLARLAESTLALVLAAILTGRIAPGSRLAPWAVGVVLLAMFIPVHVNLWARFPVWYHLYFLASLVAVSGLVGGAVAGRRAA